MNNQEFRLRKVRDFGERIGDTVLFLKKNWTRLLVLYAVFVIPFLLVGIILGANSIADFMTKFTGNLNSVSALMGGKLFLAFLMFLCGSASYGTVVYLYMDEYDKNNGQMPGIQDIANRYLKSFLYNIGYIILLALMMIPVVVVISMFFVFFQSQIAVLLVLLIPVFFILMLFAMAYALMLFPVAIIGQGSFGSAIPVTFQLLKGKWWFSVGYAIILFIIYYFFALTISTVLNLIFGLTSLNMMDPEQISGLGKSYAYVFGLSTVIQQVFYLVIFIGGGIHYYSVHEEKMGVGLEQEIDRIGEGGRKNEGGVETW